MDSARLYRKSGSPNADFEKSNKKSSNLISSSLLPLNLQTSPSLSVAAANRSEVFSSPDLPCLACCHASPVAESSSDLSSFPRTLSLFIRDSAGDQVAIASLSSRLSVIMFATALDGQLNTPIRLWIADQVV
ncbi:hypothetical protein ACLOJK_035980 [Asimina triloba]